MPDLSRVGGRRLLGRARRRAFSVFGGDRLVARLAAEQAANAELKDRVASLQSHVTHLEERLHIAEYTVRQLDEHGLVAALAHDPASFARWLTWRPPGHFYSPIPKLAEIEDRRTAIWASPKPEALPGIDLRAEAQLAVFNEVSAFASEHRVHETATPPWRYFSDNVSFGVGDALTLHGMLRRVAPARLIEIGSGMSSAMTLDTIEHYLDGKTQVTFIEPYPALLESLLLPGDEERVTILPVPLQEVPLDLFSTLTDGDILFIDSTHVVKTGSDVVWLYNQVLPLLEPGVYVHIHDMFYPFEYPEEWVLEGRAWGEAYLVRAFLEHNTDFEIVLFNTWLYDFHPDLVEEKLPRMLQNPGGGLWLRRTAKTR